MFGIPSTSSLHNRAAILATILLLGGAGPGNADSGGTNIPLPAQIAKARTLCTEIIEVLPGDARFSHCVASLAASLQSARQEHAVIEAHSECIARGFPPGSSELSLCLLSASATNQKSGTSDTSSEGTDPGNTRDRPDGADRLTTLGNISDKEKQACARTGFDPAFGAFANCIADLESALQNIDLPTN